LAHAGGDSTQKELVAHTPLKGGGKPRDERRLLGRRHFHPSLYRLWGVVAGVSGAIKTRLAGGYLQEMLLHGPGAGIPGGRGQGSCCCCAS
jgi:hypothetical protein